MLIPRVRAEVTKSVYSTTSTLCLVTELPLKEYNLPDNAIHDVVACGEPADTTLEDEWNRLENKYGATTMNAVYGRPREGRLKLTIESAQKEFLPAKQPKRSDKRAAKPVEHGDSVAA